MRPALILAFLACAAALAGCAQHAAPQHDIGALDPDYYARYARDEHIRLEGEDRAPPPAPDFGPVYFMPFTVPGFVINVGIVQPIAHAYRFFSGDNPARAARAALDNDSPDNRRWGIFRLGDEPYFRQGIPERKLLAYKANTDSDYTVRAAAIRVLNRARAPGHTDLFVAALHDDQPLVRLEAAKALANIPDPLAVTALMDTLQNDSSKDVRIAAADALRCYRTEEAAQALIAVLNDDEFSVAWQARQSLILMTAHDFRYDERAWLNYLTSTYRPFIPAQG